ncbi:hypothetical protein D9M73_187610 [compost metagenome]
MVQGLLDPAGQRRQAATAGDHQHPPRSEQQRPTLAERAAITERCSRLQFEQASGQAAAAADQRTELATLVRRADIGERRLAKAGHAEHEELPGNHRQIPGLWRVDAQAKVPAILAVGVEVQQAQRPRRQFEHGLPTLRMTACTPMPPGQT